MTGMSWAILSHTISPYFHASTILSYSAHVMTSFQQLSLLWLLFCLNPYKSSSSAGVWIPRGTHHAPPESSDSAWIFEFLNLAFPLKFTEVIEQRPNDGTGNMRKWRDDE